MTAYSLTVVTITSVVALSACTAEVTADKPVARPVRVAEVRAPEVPRGLRYAATIQPSEQVTLALKASGYIAAMHTARGVDGRVRTVQPGDVVRAGTVLVRISDADYRERVNQAEGALQEVDASVLKARRDFDRARALFDDESLTRLDLDAAQAAYEEAIARRVSANAQLASARLALADCLLIAPISGIVLERRIETGMLAGAGTPAIVLGRVGDVEATFGAPDSVMARLSLGQPLALTTEAFPGESFAGLVTAIAPSADPHGRVFAVEVTLPNRDGRLRAGMIGAIEVDTPPVRDSAVAGTAVPLAALTRSPHDAKGYSVFVIDSSRGTDVARERPVTLGATVGNAVVVTAGLQAGERVIAMGAALVTDGESVRVIP